MSLPSSNPASIIGAGGGDYTTVAAWEADLDDATFDTDYEAQITGLTADNSTVTWAGIETTGSYKAVLKAAAGQGADGTDSNGAEVDVVNNISEVTNLLNLDIEGIEFSGVSGLIFAGNPVAGGVFNFTKNVFRDNSGDCANTAAVTNAVDINFGVCLFRNGSNEALQASSGTPTINVLNCSVDSTRFAIFGSSAFNAVKNTVSMDNSNADFTANNQSYNCASDTSAAGTGSLDSKTSTDQWTDAANDDYTVKDISADIYHAGVQITGEAWFPATDLVGTAWNNPPSMGCFEFDGGVPPAGRPLPQRVLSGPFSGPLNGVF